MTSNPFLYFSLPWSFFQPFLFAGPATYNEDEKSPIRGK